MRKKQQPTIDRFSTPDLPHVVEESMVERVMKACKIGHHKAVRFIAIGLYKDMNFQQMSRHDDGFDPMFDDLGGCMYAYGHDVYYAGTEDELGKVARNYIYNDSTIWHEAVMSGQTTKGIEDWADDVIRFDKWYSVLRVCGELRTFFIGDEIIQVAKYV